MLYHRTTESQAHRVVEFGSELWTSPGAIPCSIRNTKTTLPKTTAKKLLSISPRDEPPWPLWAACDSAQSPTQYRSVSWSSDSSSHLSLCAQRVFSYCTTLKSLDPYTSSSCLCKHLWDPPETSAHWTGTALMSFLVEEMFHSLCHICDLSLVYLQFVHISLVLFSWYTSLHYS